MILAKAGFHMASDHAYLQVSALRESEAAVVFGTDIRLETCVGSAVNIKVSFLNKSLVAIRPIANPLLSGFSLRDWRGGLAETGRPLDIHDLFIL